MRKPHLVGLAGAMVVVTSITHAEVPAYDAGAVRAKCDQDWGTDYQMVEFCLDQAKEGYAEFVTNRSNALDATIDDLKEPYLLCINDWGQDWKMVEFCAGQQEESWANLLSILQTVPKDIREGIGFRCVSDWGPNMVMADYCIEQQIQSWQNLNK